MLCAFRSSIQYNHEDLTQNKNNLAIQIHNSMLALLFLVYSFYNAFLYFSTYNKRYLFNVLV